MYCVSRKVTSEFLLKTTVFTELFAQPVATSIIFTSPLPICPKLASQRSKSITKKQKPLLYPILFIKSGPGFNG
jgi:hypothetical protein